MKTSRILIALAPLAVALAAYGADAATNWGEHCAKCHGDNGKGETKMGKKLSITDLTDAKVQAKFTDADAIKAIKEGVKSADGKLSMKPIEGLSDADMTALVAHVRTLKK
jgi:cytochrome c553